MTPPPNQPHQSPLPTRTTASRTAYPKYASVTVAGPARRPRSVKPRRVRNPGPGLVPGRTYFSRPWP
ncbi:hypothetical protein PHJA_002736400 [Phtheirospermum japonicum]|uniref:Uncharacterized protein n=1 Tax=Phtheirospermum japonicum TaxID=374723 RepID=A0A830DD21_9LAMI|nr:hypothetical protein PHJA_002736400 [Phtheirospermum japonicum]